MNKANIYNNDSAYNDAFIGFIFGFNILCVIALFFSVYLNVKIIDKFISFYSSISSIEVFEESEENEENVEDNEETEKIEELEKTEKQEEQKEEEKQDEEAEDSEDEEEDNQEEEDESEDEKAEEVETKTDIKNLEFKDLINFTDKFINQLNNDLKDNKLSDNIDSFINKKPKEDIKINCEIKDKDLTDIFKRFQDILYSSNKKE